MISRLAGVLAIAALVACAGAGPPQQTSLTVFAAASLKPAFDKIGQQLRADNNLATTFNYAGTQTLMSQLTQGAPGDVFAAADTAHMETMQKAGLLYGRASVFAHNKLEIVVAKGNPKGIQALADLARRGLVVVLADPSVPAGKYAAQALKNAGVTVHPASLEQQVTGVLSKVSLGEADAGIVYVSDIVTSSKVDGVPIPEAQNVVADYPIAILKSTANQAGASAFVDLVLSGRGQAILKTAGFEGV